MFKNLWRHLLATLRDNSGKLSLEEWNKLSDDEKLDRVDEKPDDDQDKLSAEELNTKIKDLEQKVKDSEGKHSQEMSGLLYDLKQERKARQEAEDKLKTKEEEGKEDALEGRDDEDPITVKDLRALRKKDAKDRQSDHINRLKEQASDRMDRDEDRMRDKAAKPTDEFPVSYDEALDAFDALAKTDKTLWDEVNREALRPGGRPALRMYRIAVTKDPELSKKVKTSERDKIIEELDKEGRIIKKPKGPL